MVRPNWFLAFPLEGNFVLELPELPPHFRRFHPSDVHVTLAFLGPVGEAGAARAWDALLAAFAIRPRRAMDVSLGDVVPMGRGREYTALSALLERGRSEAEECIGELRHPLTEAASGRRERRPAKAHATLARPKRRASTVDRAAGLDWAQRVDVRSVAARLDRICMYTWDDTRRERLFRITNELSLDAPVPLVTA
jgi:2'-5' RNA ligase